MNWTDYIWDTVYLFNGNVLEHDLARVLVATLLVHLLLVDQVVLNKESYFEYITNFYFLVSMLSDYNPAPWLYYKPEVFSYYR